MGNKKTKPLEHGRCDAFDTSHEDSGEPSDHWYPVDEEDEEIRESIAASIQECGHNVRAILSHLFRMKVHHATQSVPRYQEAVDALLDAVDKRVPETPGYIRVTRLREYLKIYYTRNFLPTPGDERHVGLYATTRPRLTEQVLHVFFSHYRTRRHQNGDMTPYYTPDASYSSLYGTKWFAATDSMQDAFVYMVRRIVALLNYFA